MAIEELFPSPARRDAARGHHRFVSFPESNLSARCYPRTPQDPGTPLPNDTLLFPVQVARLTHGTEFTLSHETQLRSSLHPCRTRFRTSAKCIVAGVYVGAGLESRRLGIRGSCGETLSISMPARKEFSRDIYDPPCILRMGEDETSPSMTFLRRGEEFVLILLLVVLTRFFLT